MFNWFGRFFCKHQWRFRDHGYIERAGSSITVGKIMGYWTRWKCAKCGATKRVRKLW